MMPMFSTAHSPGALHGAKPNTPSQERHQEPLATTPEPKETCDTFKLPLVVGARLEGFGAHQG